MREEGAGGGDEAGEGVCWGVTGSRPRKDKLREEGGGGVLTPWLLFGGLDEGICGCCS